MRIEADVASLISAERQVVIEHIENGVARKLTFPLSLYKRNNFSQDNETFQPINEYWDSLPYKKQSEIYAIYEDIRELFDSPIGTGQLKSELTGLVTKLMDYHSTNDVQNWIKYKSNLKVPSDVKREYVYNVDTNTTVDKTYIVEDYIGLMAISVILRAMIPIWAMFSKPAKAEHGKKKEENAFDLLVKSELYRSEPMERLKRYITANISKDTHTGNHTLEFIRSEDMPLHLLSLVCVRKLLLGELYEERPRQMLAALVYTYIIDRPSPTGGDHSNQVRTKKLPKEGAGEVSENAGSILELYKARANITQGRIAEIEYSLRDIPALAAQLCPMADPEILLKDCLRAMQTSELMLSQGPGVQPAQLTLTQWVINPVVPAQCLFYIDDEYLISQVCALTETVLRHRGFKYLALFSTAISIVDERVLRVSPVGGKTQISDELADALAVNFPFVREPKRKTPSNTRIDFVQEDIRKLSTDLSQHTWRATADEALVREVLGTHVRRIPIPPNLRSDLGMMLVKSEEEFN